MIERKDYHLPVLRGLNVMRKTNPCRNWCIQYTGRYFYPTLNPTFEVLASTLEPLMVIILSFSQAWDKAYQSFQLLLIRINVNLLHTLNSAQSYWWMFWFHLCFGSDIYKEIYKLDNLLPLLLPHKIHAYLKKRYSQYLTPKCFVFTGKVAVTIFYPVFKLLSLNIVSKLRNVSCRQMLSKLFK